MVPILTTPIVSPASSHHLANSLRPSASASVRVWRLLPPAIPGPIVAISMIESHRRSELILRFSPGAVMRRPSVVVAGSAAPGHPACRRTAGRSAGSVERFQHLAQRADQLIDLALRNDERRRHGNNVAGGADE